MVNRLTEQKAAKTQYDPWRVAPEARLHSGPQHLLALGLVVLLGTVVGSLGTVGLPVGYNVSAFWPAMTIQLVAGLWFGGWGVLGGTLFAVFSNLLTGGSLANVWGFIPSNVVQSGLCALVFRRWRLDPCLRGRRDLLGFVLAGVLGANLLGAGLGLVALWLGGDLSHASQALTILVSWTVGNGLPCLLLGIPLLRVLSPLVMDSPLFCVSWWGSRRRLEVGSLGWNDLPVAARLLMGFFLAGVLPILVLAAVRVFWGARPAPGEPGFLLPVMLNLSIFLSLIISGLVARHLDRRVRVLAEGARRLGEGELDTRVELAGSDELGRLGRSFNQMAQDLKRSQRELQRSTAERERYLKELEIAHQIQRSFLPQSCPEIEGYQLAAFTLPARHVGGDFYDFIPLEEGRWGLVVADVSDKGVPAALFMALSRSLVRAYSLEYQSVPQALESFNSFVEADNPSAMFVTLFYATLHPASGKLTYINAGHNPPVILRGRDNKVVMLAAKGMALGVLPRVELQEHPVELSPGDVLVLYTDGFTEALNEQNEMFGLERMIEEIQKHQHEPAQQLMQSLLDAVNRFVGEAPQADDLTLLVIRRPALE